MQPWTCPHCKAVWHSGRQYCIDCGYGMGAAPSFPAPAEQANGQEPRLAMTVGQAQAFMEMVEASPQEPLRVAEQMTSAVLEETRQLQEALARSMAAESVLQAEVGPLRERLEQLEREVEEGRREMVAGVQRLLGPLFTLVEERGLKGVGFGGVVGVVVRMVRELEVEVRRMRVEGVPGRSGVQGGEEVVRRLVGEVRELSRRVGKLEEGTGSGEDYGTWVMTDRRVKELEEELLKEQGRGGVAYGR